MGGAGGQQAQPAAGREASSSCSAAPLPGKLLGWSALTTHPLLCPRSIYARIVATGACWGGSGSDTGATQAALLGGSWHSRLLGHRPVAWKPARPDALSFLPPTPAEDGAARQGGRKKKRASAGGKLSAAHASPDAALVARFLLNLARTAMARTSTFCEVRRHSACPAQGMWLGGRLQLGACRAGHPHAPIAAPALHPSRRCCRSSLLWRPPAQVGPVHEGSLRAGRLRLGANAFDGVLPSTTGPPTPCVPPARRPACARVRRGGPAAQRAPAAAVWPAPVGGHLLLLLLHGRGYV